jgi:uncharacterized membrane-anchored protein
MKSTKSLFLPKPASFNFGIFVFFIPLLSAILFPSVSWSQGNGLSERESQALFDSIVWQHGPATAQLGQVAELKIPEGYRFTGSDGLAKFLRANGNPPRPGLGVLVNNSGEMDIFFNFDPIGYVPDDEKEMLPQAASEILQVIKENTAEENKLRTQMGSEEIHVVDWIYPPYYDDHFKSLTWAFELFAGKDSSNRFANLDFRKLGRRGVMHIKVVSERNRIDTAAVKVREILTSGLQFKIGEDYNSFRKGDVVAAVGLTALITGIVATKGVPFFQKFGKFIAVGVIALLAGLGKMLFGGGGSASKKGN